MNTTNLKDKITNYCAAITAVCVYMLTVGIPGITLPAWTHTVFLAISGICGVITMVLTGKAPNGTAKTDKAAEIDNGNAAIKTIALLIGLTLFCNLGHAQTKPFKGFFMPKSAIQVHKNLKSTLGDITVTPTYVWKFRPAVFVTADAIKVNGGIAVTQPLSSLGTGVSLSKFIDNQGTPYEQLSISGLVMTNINLNGTALTSIGGGLIVGAFNGIVNVGGAYIGKQVYVLIGTKISL